MVMRPERIKVEPLSFGTVMSFMAQGKYRIPRFQRTFVWERSRIQTLLDSMYREYPIGTIFLWKAPPKYNHMLRSVDYLNQSPIEENQSYTFILDGQQRLTSLYVTVNGLKIGGENYGKIVADLNSEDGNSVFQYRTSDNKRWISVKDLLRENNFDIYDSLSSEARQKFQDIRQRLTSYPFSVVSVDEMELDDAIEIFERINQQSKKLTRYDLIAASILTDTFDLRERSQEDIIRPIQSYFGLIPETNIVQALSLNIKNRTEHSTQMSLSSDEVQASWYRTVECIKIAVDFVRANLGVLHVDFMPYSSMISVLSHYFYYGKTNSVKSNFHREQLEKWFWRTAFAERYSGASQTRMTEDAESLRKLVDNNTPIDFDRMPVALDEKALIQASMRSSTSAIRNGILCMLALKRPLHFANKSEIVFSGEHFSKFTSPERHHIFPIGFLQSSGYKNKIHSIPNFCFIPAELNQYISDKAPSQYFHDLREYHSNNGDFEKIMDTHLIPCDEESGIWVNDFQLFLRQRAGLIIKEIRYLCGISPKLDEEQRNPIIDAIENALRNRIHDILSATYGLDYWQKHIPNDVQTKVKDIIDKIIDTTPNVDRKQFQNPRVKLDYCDTSDYVKIITNNQNWGYFSSIFKNKSECEKMLDDFRKYRNAIKHNRAVDSVLELRGQASLIWLSKALNIDIGIS